MAHQTDKVTLAIVAVVFGDIMLSLGDSIAKFIGDGISLWQIFFVRSLFAACSLALIIRFSPGKSSFMPISLVWVALRSLAFAIAGVVFYIGLAYVHLSLMSALLLVFPLLIVLSTFIFGGDSVHPKTWFAAAFGLLGMLMIVRPATDDFNIYALLGLVTAIFYAITMLITRLKCQAEDPKVMGLGQSIALLIFGGVGCVVMQVWQPESAAENYFVLGGWVTLTAFQWAIVGLIAASFMTFSIANAFAYQNGPSPIIATFDYFYLLSSVFWGWLILAEIPNYLDAVGMVIIATAGIIIVRQPSKSISVGVQ